MATILLSSFVIRYPVGGVLSNNLQFLTGLSNLGHEVYLIEKAGYEESCFDPEHQVSSDDCSCGIRRIGELLGRHGLGGQWCYVDADGRHHGLSRADVNRAISRADLFIDRGMHRTWQAETVDVPLRVMLDPDPGFRQVKMASSSDSGAWDYDAYFTYGHNVGTEHSSAPAAGVRWSHVFHPVDTRLYEPSIPPTGAPVTTVMNWTPLENVRFEGREYGMKDIQFPTFESLPEQVRVPMEVAIEGTAVPKERLRGQGWNIVSALDVTTSYDAYHDYLRSSLAEFSVVKDVYRGLNVGWFSDRSAAYLAHGRPVVVQGNGISRILPTGEGLFEVDDLGEAADAIDRISADPARHSAAARRIAEDHLDTEVVLTRFLAELGINSSRPRRRA